MKMMQRSTGLGLLFFFKPSSISRLWVSPTLHTTMFSTRGGESSVLLFGSRMLTTQCGRCPGSTFVSLSLHIILISFQVNKCQISFHQQCEVQWQIHIANIIYVDATFLSLSLQRPTDLRGILHKRLCILHHCLHDVRRALPRHFPCCNRKK